MSGNEYKTELPQQSSYAVALGAMINVLLMSSRHLGKVTLGPLCSVSVWNTFRKMLIKCFKNEE